MRKLDINCWVDGVWHGELTGIATADACVDGKLIRDDCSDFYESIPVSAKYQFTDIKTASGYTYKGCNEALEGTVTAGEGDISVNLLFETVKQQMTVIFNANGDNATVNPTSKTVTADSAYGELPVPTRPGYSFDGWYTAANGGNAVKADTKVTSTSNHTLYAHWKAAIYTVKYDANGGSDSPETQSKKHGEDLTLSGETLYRTGYEFLGWATSPSGDERYQPGDAYSDNSDLTLYAKWWKIPDTLTLGDVNGDGKIDERDAKLAQAGYLGSVTLTKAQIYAADLNGDGEIALSDVIRIQGYYLQGAVRVLFNSNASDATVDPNSKSVSIDEPYGDLPIPTRPGYSFDGWYTETNGGNAITAESIVKSATPNQTLYAHWTAIPEATLVSIEIVNKPNKTEYKVGETFDRTGLSIKAVYSDDTNETLTSGFEVAGFDSSTAGKKAVTVTYNGKTATFDVTVKEDTQVAPNAAQIVIDNQTIAPGASFDVPVFLKNNPGVVSFRFNVLYDSSKLELVSRDNVDYNLVALKDLNSPVVFNFTDATGGDKTNAGAGILHFKAKDNATGDTQLRIEIPDEEDFYNSLEDSVTFAISSGTISIRDCKIGDVNADTKVNNRDVGRLQQYLSDWDVTIVRDAADTNGDSKVNNRDVGRLQQYLSDWDVTLGSSTARLQSIKASLMSADSMTITIEDTPAEPGSTIQVPVLLKDNPGLVSFRFKVRYDSDKLELVSRENSDYNLVALSNLNSPVVFNFTDATGGDKTNEGAGTLTFKVKDGASGNAEFLIEIDDPDDIYNTAEDTVVTTVSAGKITIASATHTHSLSKYAQPEQGCGERGDLRDGR